MQVFMRNIPFSASESELHSTLAAVLHRPPFPNDPPTNFAAELFYKEGSRRHNGLGLLTLPVAALGHTFLRTYGTTGLYLKGRCIHFSPNKHPKDEGLIQSLLVTPWEDPETLQKEKHLLAESSEPIPLKEFCFGRFCRDGSFSGEVHRSGQARVACDLELHCLRLFLEDKTANPSSPPQSHDPFTTFGFDDFQISMNALLRPTEMMTATYPISRVKAIATSNIDGLSQVFIEADSLPIIELRQVSFLTIFSSAQDDRPTMQRVSSIQNNRDMPPACRHICLTFNAQNDLNTFLHRAQLLHLPSPRQRAIPLIQLETYSGKRLDNLKNYLGTLEFGLAFEAEKAVLKGLILPDELEDVLDLLGGQLLSLALEPSVHQTPALRQLVSCLLVPGLQNTHAKTSRRGGQPVLSSGPLEKLEDCVATYHSELMYAAKNFFYSSRGVHQAYRLILTPSNRILDGPVADQSNSVLRRFGSPDRFLRVSFQDEHGGKLRNEAQSVIDKLLRSRFQPVLADGVWVAGRHYEFLGYSMSGLREHSFFFVHPFHSDDGTLLNASRIRDELGDFSAIVYKPALLGARWAQAFSTSDPSVTLTKSQILHIDDRRSGTSVFTDGCGTISTELQETVWSNLQNSSGTRRTKASPSCFQIRLGGAKGVVVHDPTLQGTVICLRPSQTKYKTTTSFTLDITATSSRPKTVFLNRPLICVLEYLGVPEDNFLRLQKLAVTSTEHLRESLSDASSMFEQYGLGTSFRIPSLFNKIISQLHFNVGHTLRANTLRHNLIELCLSHSINHVLREIKYRAHIAVPGSFTLIGVSDEWNCLSEGEIYATVFDEYLGIDKAIEGRVLITRSPQIHPGDVQFARAVRRTELSHLKNVVVFSCKGERSLPSCLAGGDLDGDIFNLILDPNLFPKRTLSPGSYNGLPHKTLTRPCGVAEVTDFVVDYIESDLLGYISNLHLRIADIAEKGPGCDECLRLAEYASHAVDYPKTGQPVKLVDLPRPTGRLRPDFLSYEGLSPSAGSSFYPSKKVLGVLFRAVQAHNPEHTSGDKRHPTDAWKINAALRKAAPPQVVTLLEEPLLDDLHSEMSYMLESYSNQLLSIATSHTVSKNGKEYLTESELVSGTIQAAWVDHRKRREAVAAMNIQTHELASAIRKELRRPSHAHNDQPADDDCGGIKDDEDDESTLYTIRRSWTAWNVAEEYIQQDPEAFGPQSFGLIALELILHYIQIPTNG